MKLSIGTANFLKRYGLLKTHVSNNEVLKIFRYLNRNKIKYKVVSENDWPLPKELYKSLNLLKKLKSKNYINFKKKFNILIASTKIIRIIN